MAKVDTRSHKHFVWDASVSTVLHPLVDHVPQESFLQKEKERRRAEAIRLIQHGGTLSVAAAAAAAAAGRHLAARLHMLSRHHFIIRSDQKTKQKPRMHVS